MCARTICSTASRPFSSNSWSARRACADSFIKRDTCPFSSILGDYSLFVRTTGRNRRSVTQFFGLSRKFYYWVGCQVFVERRQRHVRMGSHRKSQSLASHCIYAYSSLDLSELCAPGLQLHPRLSS